MAFCETFSIGAYDERYMEPSWGLPSEGLVDGELAVGAEDQIVSSGDLVDLLVMVIGDDGELVRRRAVVSCDDKVPEVDILGEGLGAGE